MVFSRFLGRVVQARSALAATALSSAFVSTWVTQPLYAESKTPLASDDVFIVKKALSPDEWRQFKVVNVKPVTHDTVRLRIALPTEHHITGLRTASCLVVKANINGKTVIRPYTPTTMDNQLGYFDLTVKGYPEGKLSKHLVNLEVGDSVEVKGPFQKIPVEPNMKKSIGLIAGGSGITPMLQVIQHLLADPRDNTEIRLLFANRTEQDIILKPWFDALALMHPRFKVYYTVDQATSRQWEHNTGRVSKEMIARTMPPPSKDSLIMVCGPPPMMKAISGDKKSKTEQGDVTGLLKEMKYTNDMVFKF